MNTLLTKLDDKISAQRERLGPAFLFAARNGKYQEMPMQDVASYWTNGFWPGILWQLYHTTGKDTYRMTAEEVEERMDEALACFEGLYHDVGFMYSLSSVANYRLTKNNQSRRRALHAATLLAGRFNIRGMFLRAWNDTAHGRTDPRDVRGYMIVDSLMNLPLLYWASEETNDPRFRHIAVSHGHTALQYMLREDGSCCHIIHFDPETGAFLGEVQGQGYGIGSAWSRGLGWAVYGLGLSYRHTKEQIFLDGARKCADYAIKHLTSNDWITPVDFSAPKEPIKNDASAGAILACGLMELASHLTANEYARYWAAGEKLLNRCIDTYGNWKTEEDGLLMGSSLQYHQDMLANTPVIYGDYFLVEGILRKEGKAMQIW